jgi:hypothetical protein
VSTDRLIRELAADARPVRRLAPLRWRVLGWLALAAVSLALVLMMMGVRRTLGDNLDRVDFALETVLLIVTAISAAIGALLVSVPGRERSAAARWIPLVAGASTILWAAGEIAVAAAMGAPADRVGFAWHCIYKTASVAAVPGIVLFVMVRRAAPMYAARAGLLALLATAAVGVIGANIICPYDRPVHMFVWHVAPIALFAALGGALGAWLLRWPRQEIW